MVATTTDGEVVGTAALRVSVPPATLPEEVRAEEERRTAAWKFSPLELGEGELLRMSVSSRCVHAASLSGWAWGFSHVCVAWPMLQPTCKRAGCCSACTRYCVKVQEVELHGGEVFALGGGNHTCCSAKPDSHLVWKHSGLREEGQVVLWVTAVEGCCHLQRPSGIADWGLAPRCWTPSRHRRKSVA